MVSAARVDRTSVSDKGLHQGWEAVDLERTDSLCVDHGYAGCHDLRASIQRKGAG